MKEIRCYNCNQPGHFVKACPVRPGNSSQGREPGTRAWSRNWHDRKKHKGRWSKRDWHNNQSHAQNQTQSSNWNQGQLGGMPALSNAFNCVFKTLSYNKRLVEKHVLRH